MKAIILLLFLTPIVVRAQEVKPIESADYLALIKTDSATNKATDSTNSVYKATLRYSGNNFSTNFLAKQITIAKNNTLQLQPVIKKMLFIGGIASANIVVRRSNQQPVVQQQYVQGRNANGSLVWQGPHSNELFSYGPAINTLEFDGSNYPYDVNGQLVAAGTANKINAATYNSSIFNTATLFSTAVMLQAKYRVNYVQVVSLTLKAAQSNEHTFIKFNKNNTANFSAAVEGIIKKFTLSSSYNYLQTFFSNSNRTGFLNRVYQNALLTPVSFNNRQGNTMGATQKSYSQYADNPFFLLENNGHSFLQQHFTADFNIERRFENGKIKLSQSYQKTQALSNEGYKPSTAFFENGVGIKRQIHTANYLLNINAVYNIPFTQSKLKGNVTGNYIFGSNQADIKYLPQQTNYNYRRLTHDASISYAQTYNSYSSAFEAGVFFSNKIYASTTATKRNFFIPGISFFTRFNELFDNSDWYAKIKASLNYYNSELPITTSFAQSSLTQFTASNAAQHIAITEANSFNKLLPIQHKEYNWGMEAGYKNKVILTVDWFNRYTDNDVFPIVNNSQIELINMANHYNRGIEIGLNLFPYHSNNNQLHFTNSLSFTQYRTKVTNVKEPYNFTPIAGFSDVNKAIVKNAPLGAIVGNSFLKDATNNIVIGNDGFPLVNNNHTVIGNPAPDFIIKNSHRLSWKNWDLTIDWEWRKGGDIWNGTAALLDYYGKSLTSANLRNTTNYIFNGVDVTGKTNTTAVSFYNPLQPLQQNRWIRYGPTGIAESYLQKGDCIRLNTIALSFNPKIKKYLQQLNFSVYASNLILWSAYKGADPYQLLNDQAGTSGLDFFNIPSYHSFGFSVSLKF